MEKAELTTAAEKMNLKHIQVSRQEIETELAQLREAMDKGYIEKNNKIVVDLMKVLGHLKHNGVVIDIWESLHKIGVDDGLNPKLAIVRADSHGKACYIYKYNNGSAVFSIEAKRDWTVTVQKSLGDLRSPPGTFTWTKDDLGPNNRRWKCAVPIIPPRICLAVSQRIIPQHYYILFEPDGWVKYNARPRAPRDPILGKMLTKNLFGVLATWDLTDLELKIIEGL